MICFNFQLDIKTKVLKERKLLCFKILKICNQYIGDARLRAPLAVSSGDAIKTNLIASPDETYLVSEMRDERVNLVIRRVREKLLFYFLHQLHQFAWACA